MLVSDGDQLIQNNHYAVDCILPKCNELRHYCDTLTGEIKKRRALLNLSRELHNLLEKVKPALEFSLLFPDKWQIYAQFSWSSHC